jgi:hypothetical protein
MRQSLQSKFNLLGLLFVAFFLLMLPMFTQVKQDTRDSMKEARSTTLYKFSNQLMKDFKPPEDTQVEDYWAEQQEQMRKDNPDCPACNPDGDADGDNVTNKDEVEQGRNPLCNEDKLGMEYCQNADRGNLTDPDDPLENVPRVLIQDITFTPNNCTSVVPGLPPNCRSWTFEVTRNFTLLEAQLNVTDFQGSSWSVDMVSENDGNWDEDEGTWSDSRGAGLPGSSQDYTGIARLSPSGPSPQEARFNFSGGTTGDQGGTWHILVYGIR